MTSVSSGEPGFYAHTLLQRRCQGCHARPKPEKLSAEKWQAALDRMHKKVRLEAADWDSLAALARRDSTAGALPSQSSAGGDDDSLGDDRGNR